MSDAMESYVNAMESDFLPSLKTCYTALDLDGLKRDDATRAAIDALGVVLRRMESLHNGMDSKTIISNERRVGSCNEGMFGIG